ncbi:MAG: hypothetical protein WBG82_12075 [Parvibaculum sp.]|uniref:hypothetical protein n=1 Tax=Parvibaculum sp. TaxID=2024848 RepID=UPI003C726927
MAFPIEPAGQARRLGIPSPRRIGLAALLIAPLALGGCSWLGMGSDDEADVLAAAPKPCPTIGVLDGADRITMFNGRGLDLTDVVVRGEIRKAVSKCEYDDGEIAVDVAFDGQADLGPAATSRELNLKGFMTVVRNGRISDKQVFDIPVVFEGAARTVRFLKTIEDTKLATDGRLDGSAYELLVGFQLSPEELEYNRKVPSTPLK